MSIGPEVQEEDDFVGLAVLPDGDDLESEVPGDIGADERDRTSVRAQLTEKLRRLIMDGIYKMGDRMTERELCDRLNASRPSLREALRQLEAEGLIDILPNRGPVVKTVSQSDLLELWDVRSALEILITRQFVLNGTERQIEEFEQSIHAFDAALRSENVRRIRSTKTALCEAFAAGANSAILASYFRQVNARTSFVWSSSLLFAGRPAESISELLVLLTTIRNRNPVAAEAAMRLHIEHAKAIALHGLSVLENSRRMATADQDKSIVSAEPL